MLSRKRKRREEGRWKGRNKHRAEWINGEGKEGKGR